MTPASRMPLLCLVVFLAHFPMNSGVSSYYLPGSILTVTAVALEPYLMVNPDYLYDSSQQEYIGYIPDLLSEISRLTRLEYVITISPDNTFGHRQSDGTWSGMIGEILSQRADIAAAPMYRTSQRSSVVDFTEPYMDVQATLLLRKPPSGKQLQIRSLTDLINQSEIKYGTLDRGVLIRAFRATNDTLLKIMWRNMLRFEPSVFTETNQDGIDLVRDEKYGFILPHTIGEYMSMQEPCDLITVERFLMKRGYSLAVAKNSGLLEQVDRALGTLRKSGYLDQLYRKWWTERSQCGASRTSRVYGSRYSYISNGSDCYHNAKLPLLPVIIMFCKYFLST